MLRILREHATSWMLRGLLILVAVTFISWGGYSLIRERKVTYAAKVNGETIDPKDYAETLQAMTKQYREMMGSSFTEKMAGELKLGERALDSLVSQVLLLQEAKRLGLQVSDEELRESIESSSYFQVGGQFDRRNYERFLRMNRMTAEDFERIQRDHLLISKISNLIRLNSGRVSEEEALENYRFENERMNLQFVKVGPETFKGQVAVNEIEERDYYQKHQEEFRIPTSIQIQYLVFRPSDYEGKAQVTSEEIKRYYDVQKERLKVPKRVKAREILIKVEADDPTNKIEEKKRRAEEVLEKAKKTKDFAALAKQYSESATASKGGELGWVQTGALEASLQGPLFSLKGGETSELLKGMAGFYILKAEEVVDEKQRSLEEVKDQIAQGLKREKGKIEASRKADDAFYSMFRSRDLESYSRENSIPLQTTGLFKEGDEIPELGRNEIFQSNAFALKVGEISAVITIPPNFYILKAINKKESRIPAVEEVKEELKKKVVGVKADEKAKQVAEELLKQVQSGKTLREVGQGKGFPVEESGFFTRGSGAVPKIGPNTEFASALASLTEKNPVPKEVLRTKDGYFIVRLLASEPADDSKFSASKANLEKRLAFQKQEEFFRNWLEQLKAKSKIEINKDIFKS
jgi:peptidyl-prolyl cis-trans isomerase D